MGVASSAREQVSRYLSAIRGYPLLSAEEEEELLRRWREDGDQKAAARIIESHLRLVLRVAVGFKGYGLPHGDLIAEGNLGLLRALQNFQPGKGARFATYAMWWIRAAMYEYAMRQMTPVSYGLSVERKKLFFKLRALKAKLMPGDALQLSPGDVAEIARQLEVRPASVVEMERLMDNPVRSLDAPLQEDGSATWLEQLTDEGPNPEEIVAARQESAFQRRLLKDAWAALNEREQDILQGRRLRDVPLRLEDLGKRYGISAERVRQIEVAAVNKLRKLMTAALPGTAMRA